MNEEIRNNEIREEDLEQVSGGGKNLSLTVLYNCSRCGFSFLTTERIYPAPDCECGGKMIWMKDLSP